MISAFRQSRDGTRPIKVSFEFFPPKTPEMEATLWASIERLAPLRPQFVSVTYGAGGSTRERTHATVARLVRETPLKPAAHLTCVAARREEIDEVVRSYWDAGVRHVVALRGDPAGGLGTAYAAHPGGYEQTCDLVAGIKRAGNFEVSVSAYPEKHPEATSLDADIDALKSKVDCGADRAITQFFFDNDVYFRYLDRVRARGITIPIVPGIVPVQNFKQTAEFCGEDRRERPGLARGPLRRARKRCRDAQADRGRRRCRAGHRSSRSGRERIPLLHDESRRPRLCHLPPLGIAGAAAGRKSGSLIRRARTWFGHPRFQHA